MGSVIVSVSCGDNVSFSLEVVWFIYFASEEVDSEVLLSMRSDVVLFLFTDMLLLELC